MIPPPSVLFSGHGKILKYTIIYNMIQLYGGGCMELKIRFEEEFYEALKDAIKDPEAASKLVREIRDVFRGTTITIKVEPVLPED